MRPALPIGYRRHRFDALPSTNAEALAAARRGEAGGLWITAAVQTAGRGRRGRPWATAPGNLAASLLVTDPCPGEMAATLSFVAAVALHEAVVAAAEGSVAARLGLKWPNDLLLDGGKVAGILVEGENLANGHRAVVIGIGVNCVSHPDVEGPLPAVDFAGYGVAVDAESLFAALAAAFDRQLAVWDRGRGFDAIRTAWLERAAGIGAPVRVNLAGRSAEGQFEALDAEGRLVLRTADGRREAFSAGDVFPLAAG